MMVRRLFMEAGGEPVYAAWRLSYEEPVIEDFLAARARSPQECPVAERVQPTLLQFKTNFGSVEAGLEQATVLRRVLGGVEG